MIELLVVIGVLGILAAGLLATIDPLEQLRKGTDTNRKTTALEFVNSVTRYYATRGAMPWGNVTGCNIPSGSALNSMTVCMQALIDDGELKATFDDDLSALGILADIFVSGTASTVVACYDPESKSESRRTETKYLTSSGTGACDPATSNACFWCAQ